MVTQENEKQESLVERTSKKKVLQFLFRNKLTVLLFLALLTLFIWAKVKINSLEKDFALRNEQLIHNYEFKIDSLSVKNIELTSKVFSWAIRSELIRENVEEVNHFFISFIKEPNVVNVKLINPENSIIFISTDKKEEGQEFGKKEFLSIANTATIKDSNFITVVNPIMGLNKKLGVLVIVVKSENKLE